MMANVINLFVSIIQVSIWSMVFSKVVAYEEQTNRKKYIYIIAAAIGLLLYFSIVKKAGGFVQAKTSLLFILIAVISTYATKLERRMLHLLLVLLFAALAFMILFIRAYYDDGQMAAGMAIAVVTVFFVMMLCQFNVQVNQKYGCKYNNSEIALISSIENLLVTIFIIFSEAFILYKVSAEYTGQIWENTEIDQLNQTMIFTMIPIAVILIIATRIYEICDTQLKKQIINISYEQNQSGVDNIRRMYEEASKVRHDAKNCMSLLDDYIQNQEYEEAHQFIADYVSQQINILGMKVFCSNKVLNYIINNKFTLCHQKNIETKCIVSGDVQQITDVDLSILMGNLLDNAIEAAFYADNPMISVEIYDEQDIHIIIDNSIKQSVLQRNPHMKTTKPEKNRHGWGTISIRDIVRKYNGTISYSELGKEIRCEIRLKKRR